MVYDAKTKAMLRERGVNCICQLCDCGRPHKHKGCTKHWSGVALTSKGDRTLQNETDYSSFYSRHIGAHPATAFRPPCRERNPDPPPMDFRTVNRVEYKPHGSVAKQEPLKLKGEIESIGGTVEGKSIYRSEYPAYDVKPVTIRKGTTSMGKSNASFEGKTTYNEIFGVKVADHNPSFSDLPSFTYSILYPGKPLPAGAKSHTQDVHTQLNASKTKRIDPPSSTIQLGDSEVHDLDTTHRKEFKTQNGAERAQIMRPRVVLQQRPKFTAITQSQDDFKGFKGNMPKPVKPITPPPETILIGQNNKQSFQTTNREEIRVNWDPSTVVFERAKKPEEHYIPPNSKFDSKSMTHSDFKKHDTTRVSLKKPVPQISQAKVKFEDKTSYSCQFPRYSNTKTYRYGDFCESNTYLPPSQKFHEDGSVTHQDFNRKENGKPSTPFKPLYNMHTTKATFEGITSYKESYKPQKLKECTFPGVLAEFQQDVQVK